MTAGAGLVTAGAGLVVTEDAGDVEVVACSCLTMSGSTRGQHIQNIAEYSKHTNTRGNQTIIQ